MSTDLPDLTAADIGAVMEAVRAYPAFRKDLTRLGTVERWLRRQRKALQQPIVFRRAEPGGCWRIGDREVHVSATVDLGLWVLFYAIRDEHDGVRQFSRKCSVNAVRNATRAAAAWLERECPELATAALRVTVKRDGSITYRRNGARIITT